MGQPPVRQGNAFSNPFPRHILRRRADRFALRQCLPMNATSAQNWEDIELAGDGRKYPYHNPQPTY